MASPRPPLVSVPAVPTQTGTDEGATQTPRCEDRDLVTSPNNVLGGSAAGLATTAAPHVIGLDLGLTRVGVAARSGADSFVPPPGFDEGFRRMRWIRSRVLGWTDRADLVVVESPAFSSNGKYAKENAGLWHVVMISVDARGTRWISVQNNTAKKYATGNGRAEKGQMLAAAFRRGLPMDVDNDDEADAAWLCAIGHDLLGAPLVTLPAAQRDSIQRLRGGV